MTRKHYIAIARLIDETRAHHNGDGANRALNAMTLGLAEICKQDNARFDEARFFNASGLVR